ncbi:MAG: class I SAM-dependent methyltransferase [Gammaproteobacteria bacterium]|nr:class I SAM-dependent methyltransferase [Gammaproteobacteria bacterium]
MQSQPKIEEFVEWDTQNWKKALEFWSSSVGGTLEDKKVLEIGCNNGGISLWAANQGATVICSDIVEPTQKAKDLHAKYGLSSRISYEVIDATNIPYENYFDLVIFKSVLGGIGRVGEEQKKVLVVENIHKCLKSSGMVLFAENLKGSLMHQVFRKLFVGWGSSWGYPLVREISNLFSGFSSCQISTYGFLACFGKSEAMRRFLSFADKFVSPIVPANSRYIVFGVAVK